MLAGPRGAPHHLRTHGHRQDFRPEIRASPVFAFCSPRAYSVCVGKRWATVTVTDSNGQRHSVDVHACSTFDAAHLFVAHAKANPQNGLPPLGAETVFE